LSGYESRRALLVVTSEPDRDAFERLRTPI
jgi:hypothetical protein